MAKTSPTQRSLKLLREDGYSPWVVETTIPSTFIKRDLWHFGDILAQREGSPPLIVQTTSGANSAARVEKILASKDALVWVKNGGRIEVHGWRKLKVKRGGKATYWDPKVVEITLRQFGPCVAYFNGQLLGPVVGDIEVVEKKVT